PALRTFPDVAVDIDHHQQDHAEQPQRKRQSPKERGLHLRERTHREPAETRANRRVGDTVPTPARGAVQDDEAVDRDQSEADEQRAVELECAQDAARGGERASAARTGFDGFVDAHYSSPAALGGSAVPFALMTCGTMTSW